MCLFYIVGAPLLFSLMTDIGTVRSLLDTYHLWLPLVCLLAAPCYLLDGVFIGTTQTRYMMYSMAIASMGVYLPCWYLTQGWGNHGLWLAFALFNASRGVTLGWFYWRIDRRNGWAV